MPRLLHILLFIFWPLIACVLLFCMTVLMAFAWVVIPFGRPVVEGTEWKLKFPWSKD